MSLVFKEMSVTDICILFNMSLSLILPHLVIVK